MAIMVQGKKCKVLDKGGYNCDIGQNWKMVELDGERVMVVGGRGFWRVWGARDRTAPLREAIARGWPHKQAARRELARRLPDEATEIKQGRWDQSPALREVLRELAFR